MSFANHRWRKESITQKMVITATYYTSHRPGAKLHETGASLPVSLYSTQPQVQLRSPKNQHSAPASPPLSSPDPTTRTRYRATANSDTPSLVTVTVAETPRVQFSLDKSQSRIADKPRMSCQLGGWLPTRRPLSRDSGGDRRAASCGRAS